MSINSQNPCLYYIKKKLISLCLLCCVGVALQAQPCLSGWQYRVPITVTNTTANSLTDYQIQVTFNTQDLVANAKLQVSGADIRFVSSGGSVLNHWIDEDQFSSTASTYWVKVSSIPASSSTIIYLFYGNTTATDIATGDGTFELFDDFDDASINTTKWSTTCGGGGTATETGGSLTFTSTAAGQKVSLKSQVAISSPVIVETDVESVSNGQNFVGLIDNASNGYAINYEVNTLPLMLMREINSDGGSCFNLGDVLNPANQTSRSANTTTGLWSFAWYSSSNQSFAWQGQTATEERTETEHTLPSSVYVILGQQALGAANFQIDWLGARKHITTAPTVSVGSETDINAEVTASATGTTLCQGSTVELFASATAGATYAWSGPNGFTSTDQNPSRTSLTTADQGEYIVTASLGAATGCPSYKDTVDIVVNAPTTNAGTLSGATTVCASGNTGTVSVSGHIGEVVRWESSVNGDEPWSTIANTSTSLTYTNLVQTIYYRVVIQNGACDELASAAAKIQVDPITEVGAVLGATEVCFGTHTGQLRLTDFEGSVNQWQYSTGTGVWNDTAVTDTFLVFSDLPSTRYYRAVVQSGVCTAALTDSILVKVNPLPVPAFSSPDQCLGLESNFTDLSTIAEGSITNYIWDYTDGNSDLVSDPIHLFDSSGTYPIKLKLTSDKGCIDSLEQNLIIHPLPQVSFVQDHICQREEMTFKPNVGIATGSFTSYTLRFGQGDDFDTNTDGADFVFDYDTAGTYTATLVVTSDQGCTDSLSKEVIVYPRATLAFSADSVYEGQSSQFINNSFITEGNLSYAWAFGDLLGTSELVNPSYSYAEADTFQIRLISTSTYGGCKDTLFQEYIVYDQAEAAFNFDNECTDDSVSFTNLSQFVGNTSAHGDSIKYVWSFGDGTYSTEENPKHKYTASGNYFVSLSDTANYGSVSSITKIVTIYPEPRAEFDFENICQNQEANFKSLASVSSGSLDYFWEFGDGEDDNIQDADHLYTKDTTYDVLHYVVTDFQCVDSITRTITIYPSPNTSFEVDTACHETASIFENLSDINDGSIEAYQWNFGDQTNSIITSPSKIYTDTGTYEVVLTATSDQGCVMTDTNYATVLSNPIANFTVLDTCFTDETQTNNLSTSIDGEMSFAWDFGDATHTSVSSDTSIIFNSPDNYDVKLVATTEYGCVDSVIRPVTIQALPTPYVGEDTIVSKGFEVQLTVSDEGEYFWSPSEGLDDQLVADPIATPLETTTYTLEFTDVYGCIGSDEITIQVKDDFLLLPSNVISPDGNNKNDFWEIENITNFEKASVQIFDLWGRKIFETTNYQNNWGGTSGTDILPTGEYFYLIQSPDHDKIYKGTITILRH